MCKIGVLRETSLALQKAPVKCGHRDFPGGAVVKNLPSNQGTWDRSLVGELRSHKLRGNSLCATTTEPGSLN